MTQVLPGTTFRVDLPGQRNVLAHISDKMRKHFIRIVPGDKVSVELSPYDLTKAHLSRTIERSTIASAIGARLTFPFLEDLFVPAFAENDQHADTGSENQPEKTNG